MMDRISVLDAYDSTAALTQHWPAVGTGAFAFVPHEEEVIQEKWNKNEGKYELVDDDIGLQQNPMVINWDGKHTCEETVMPILLTGTVIIQSSHSFKRNRIPKRASCL